MFHESNPVPKSPVFSFTESYTTPPTDIKVSKLKYTPAYHKPTRQYPHYRSFDEMDVIIDNARKWDIHVMDLLKKEGYYHVERDNENNRWRLW